MVMIVHVLDVRLEVAVQGKGIKCQGHKEFPKEFSALFAPLLVALFLDIGPSSRPLKPLSLFLASPDGVCIWPPPPPTSGAPYEDRQSAPGEGHQSSRARWVQAQDLANFSTKAYLEGRSATKKTTAGPWAVGDPRALSKAEHSPECGGCAGPSIPLPLAGGGSTLSGWGQSPQCCPAHLLHTDACAEDSKTSQEVFCRTAPMTVLFLLATPLWPAHSLEAKAFPVLTLHKTKGSQVRTKENDKWIGTSNTLRVVLENKEADDGKEKVLPKEP
ncbi:hypothetical protein Cgig2_016934 [Carnegiea gigantea]|uniref:Uncharacterized protein n=1 Tax=Carnegiea gigantea TaxID=171969 RepID=A0A9Q1GXH1_9CARY|nr:hypothetical protein Cgig2_016934 [Carnegiea gigantea]